MRKVVSVYDDERRLESMRELMSVDESVDDMLYSQIINTN